ncbi:9987_t:CDS:2, partial [Funneliformis caledonium]
MNKVKKFSRIAGHDCVIGENGVVLYKKKYEFKLLHRIDDYGFLYPNNFHDLCNQQNEILLIASDYSSKIYGGYRTDIT